MTSKESVPLYVLTDIQHPQSTTAVQQLNVQRAKNAATEQLLEQSIADDKLLPFTQSQLSLALSIQRLRPANISTRDYCLQLRKHIKLGKPPNGEELRYIDTTEFWRDQYSTLYLEKQRLAARVAQLELLAKQGRGSDEVTTVPREDNGPSFQQMFSNFLVAPAEHQFSNESAIDQSSTLIKGLEAPNCLPILKHALILYRILQDNKVPTDVLLSAILSLLSSMIATIKETCEIISSDIRRSKHPNDFCALHILDTAAAAFNICLKGLRHLCRDIPGRRSKGQVIYALVHFYKTCLGQIDELCIQEASCKQSQISRNKVQELNSQSHDYPRCFALNSGYVDFLTKLLRCSELQIEHPVCTEVIEGLFSTLLEAIGGHLSQIVFGERLSTSGTSGGVHDISTNISCPILSEQVAELTGRKLAFVLKRAIEGRSDEQKRFFATVLGDSQDGCTIPTILMRARHRLQETLLKAVFGDNGREFLNSLKMPESLRGLSEENSQVVEVREGTFVEAVWSAIGWDLILNI